MVFKTTPAGVTTAFFAFDYLDGGEPYGSVIQGTDGNFYGTSTDWENIFELSPQGVLTVLHFFVFGSGDGSLPITGLVQATDGNLYGNTQLGGTMGQGVLFQVTSSGGYSILYNFDTTNGAQPLSNLMQHTNGTLYGLAEGGNNNKGVFYSLNMGLGPFVAFVANSGKVGKTIEILGQGFTGTTGVSFNGTPAKFAVPSDTYLTAIVPPGATTGPVTVATPSGTLTSNKSFRVTPAIVSFDPPSGAAGTAVTVTGTSFTQTEWISFGKVSTTDFTVNSDAQVTVTVPAGAGSGNIGLTTPGGWAVSQGAFTVTPD
jgi:uncharacterized repeat protein (TIGR03803 family)